MSLSREEITAAEKMHRAVVQYESQRKMWPWTACAIVPSFLMIIGDQVHHRDPSARYFIGFYALIFFFTFVTLKFRAAWCRDSRVILDLLEREHGDELPWVQEKKTEAKIKEHLAAVQKIEQELAKNPAAA